MRKIVKLEHSALVIENGACRIAIDPGSMTGAVSRKRLAGVTAVLVTHRHGDHLDMSVLKEIGAPVYGPPEVMALAITAGLTGKALLPGEEADVAGLKVVAVPANHGPAVTNGVQNYGFVVTIGDSSVYVTGDVAGPQGPLPAGPFGIVALPVEGGGFVFSGNDAAEFLRGLGHTGVALALHADGAPAMQQEFVRNANGFCKPTLLDVGQAIQF